MKVAMPTSSPLTLEKVISLAKRRGFVFPTSEIYGGLANSYDYGPIGVELLRNIKNNWWKYFITQRTDLVGVDTQILLHPATWVASGHVDAFHDPLVEDVVTHRRYRADHLIEEWLNKNSKKNNLEKIDAQDMTLAEMTIFINKFHLKSPDGNQLTIPKKFNLLFETAIGSVEGEKSKVYLRGETAQGIFTNFKQILDSTRLQLPFGIGNIGRSFRNEVTTGQFIFRTLEFEQAEIEYFFDPQQDSWQELLEKWKNEYWQFITEELAINKDHLKWRQHTDKERSHYSQDTWDLDYQYPFGFKELLGLAYRTDYDLKVQQQHSGKNLEYIDPHSNKKIIPHVIEPAVGVSRMFLMVLCDAYFEDINHQRIVLKINPKLAPYKAAIFPLAKNKPDLVKKAQAVFTTLSQKYNIFWDDRSSIGKRYLYQDEIGTPFCITVDYQTLDDDTVTLRDRDTTNQIRINSDQLVTYLTKRVE